MGAVSLAVMSSSSARGRVARRWYSSDPWPGAPWKAAVESGRAVVWGGSGVRSQERGCAPLAPYLL